MDIIITILITAVVVGPVCWFGGANNARKTLAVKDAAKGVVNTLRD